MTRTPQPLSVPCYVAQMLREYNRAGVWMLWWMWRGGR